MTTLTGLAEINQSLPDQGEYERECITGFSVSSNVQYMS